MQCHVPSPLNLGRSHSTSAVGTVRTSIVGTISVRYAFGRNINHTPMNQHHSTRGWVAPDEGLKLFNICAYQNGERILKELIEVANRADAVNIGKAVLYGNGFKSLRGIRFEAVLLD
jgi:hypothetical protein